MPTPRFEILTGVIDGVNLVFTASTAYTTGTTAVFLNGQLLQNAPLAWSESDPSGGEVTLTADNVPRPGDVVQMFYIDTSPPLPGTEVTELDGTIEDLDDLDGVIGDVSVLYGTSDGIVEADGRIMETSSLAGVAEDVQEIDGLLEVCS